MKIGSKGIQVAELQADLYKAGFDPGLADGSFGVKTEQAVKVFQKANGLTADGVAGPVTVVKLTSQLTRQAQPSMDAQLSKNFREGELACRHCNQILIDRNLVTKLQDLRDLLGKPITITSGYRCPTHNKNIGGATQSRHMQGQAADIVVAGMTPPEVAKAAEKVGFGGIGIYNKSKFTHVDVGPSRRWTE